MQYLIKFIVYIFLFYFISSCSVIEKSKVLQNIDVSCRKKIDGIRSSNLSVLMISSTGCGHCIFNIENLNLLREKHYKKIDFIVIYKESLEQIEDSRMKNLEWKKVTEFECLHKPLWKKSLFPEFHIFKENKLIKSFYGISDEKTKIIDQFLRENQV